MEAHSISQAVFDRILAFLTNIFLPTCEYDRERAQLAALEALSEYDPRTNRELRFAALALAFSLGALDALSQAMDTDRTVNQVLRLRSCANTLHRSARQAEEALAEEREAPQPETEEDAALPETPQPAELAAFTRKTPPLSRQQRRKQEQEAERRRRKAEHRARQAVAASRERPGAATTAA